MTDDRQTPPPDAPNFSLLHALPEPAIVTDGDLKLLHCNPAAEQLLGCPAADLLGRDVSSLLPLEVQEPLRSAAQQTLSADTSHPPLPVRLTGEAATPTPVELSITVLPQEEGNRLLITLRDSSEIASLSELLRQSDERYQSILGNIEDGYFEVDLVGNMTFCNDSLLRMLGFSREELLGMNYKQYMDSANAKKVFKEFNRVFATGEPIEGFAWELIRKDGVHRYGETSISLIRDSAGDPIGFRGIARDITERRHAEEALRESEERFRMLIEQSPLATEVYNTNGVMLSVNQAWTELWDPVVEELIGVYNILEDKRYKKSGQTDLLKRIFHGEQLKIPDSFYSPAEWNVTGPGCWLRTHAYHVRDTTGKIQAVVMQYEDITEQKLAEVERERLIDDLNAFSTTVAHDLKNPLSNIVGRAEALMDEIGSIQQDEMKRHLAIISRSGRKIDSIVDNLLLLAGVRDMEIELSLLNMADILSESVQRVSHGIERHHAEVIMPDAWPTVMGYGPWVEEIWVNYLSNAIKYGGRPPRVELGSTLESNNIVRFWVRDNGVGISANDQTRLFTPFTRLDHSRGPGHGLGLSIVLRITERLGGEVGVESEVGRGSIFSFTLPRAHTTGKPD
jgi:PAS domain S-box-containing protein